MFLKISYSESAHSIYSTQPLKASCYDHFEICLLYTACKQQYIHMMLLTISNSKSAYLITPYSR